MLGFLVGRERPIGQLLLLPARRTTSKNLHFPTATSDWGYVSGVFIADGSGTSDNILLYGQLTTAKECHQWRHLLFC